MTPRLLDVKDAAEYLGGISEATIRRLVERGELRPVRLPSVRHAGEMGRRLLFDVRDLDAVVEKWKRELSPEPNQGLSRAALAGWKNTPLRKRGAA